MSDFPEDVMKLARETAEAFTWSSTTTDEATAIARAIMQDRDSRAPSANNSGSNGETLEKACRNDPNGDPENENIGWHDGVPSKPWADEWFIAETTYGYRVVLTALPEEFTYDFKTAEHTYIKADKIKRWMQFPDSQYLPPASPPPASAEVIERLVKALQNIRAGLILDGCDENDVLIKIADRALAAAKEAE